MRRALDLILFALCASLLERLLFETVSEFEQGVVAGGAFVLLVLMVMNWILDWQLRQKRRDLDALRQARHPEILN